MPRPRQRRGGDEKKEAKRMKREAEEATARALQLAAKRERYKKSEMNYINLPHRSASASAQRHDQVDEAAKQHRDSDLVDNEDELPLIDADTKAYFQAIEEKIKELQSIHQHHHRPRPRTSLTNADVEQEAERAEEEEEEEEDERPLLLRSALEQLSSHELALAGDNETSLILERLLFSMDDFARRVLADRFAGNYLRLIKHRCASHVLQTLFALAGETVDRETRGIIAQPPTSSSSSSSSSSLPTMSTLLISIITELIPSLPSLLYDPFGSHPLRILLQVVAGKKPLNEPSHAGGSAKGVGTNAERSKSSNRFRKAQGPMKSFLLEDDHDHHHQTLNSERTIDQDREQDLKGKGRMNVPIEFAQVLKTMFQSFESIESDPSLSKSGIFGDGVRKAAMDSIAGPAVRILIELEAEHVVNDDEKKKKKGWRKKGWTDRVLCGLIEEMKKPKTKTEQRDELRSEYLAGLLRHPSSAPTFETILRLASPEIVEKIWIDFFEAKLHRVAGNAVANFVVAVALSRLETNQFEAAVEEIEKIARERRAEWIDNSRTGVFKTLLDRAAELRVKEKQVAQLLLDTFGLTTREDQLLVIPCVLSLNRLEYYRKLPSHLTAEPTIQGSLLLQSWFKLDQPHAHYLYESLASLSIPEGLKPLFENPISSRIIDAFLDSPTTAPKELRRFLLSLIGSYAILSDDRIGSRLIEHCWSSADVFLKDKIAESISKRNELGFLQQSQWSHFWAKKMELPLWERRRGEWKEKMRKRDVEIKGLKVVNTTPNLTALEGQNGIEKEKKKKRIVDEVDEIFDSKALTKKKLKSTNGQGHDGGEGLVDIKAIEEQARKNALEQKQSRNKLTIADGMDDVLNTLKT